MESVPANSPPTVTNVTKDPATRAAKVLTGIISLNVRGLSLASDRSKPAQLRDLAVTSNALAIALTETWLSPDILDAEVGIEGFNIIRSDRTSRHRGGTCLYIKEGLGAVPVLQYSNGVVDALVVKVAEIESIISVIYRPPDTKEVELAPALNEIERCILDTQTANPKFTNVLCFGDLNLPQIKWPEGLLSGGDSIQNRQAEQFLEFMSSMYLEQKVDKPTRLSNILDLVLCNNHEMISHIEFQENSNLSDHCTLFTFMNIMMEPVKEPSIEDIHSSRIPLYNLRDSDDEDWLQYKCLLDKRNWSTESEGLTLIKKVSLLTSMMESAVSLSFPLRKKKEPGNRIPASMRNLMRKKSQISRNMRKTKDWKKLIKLKQELEEAETIISNSHQKKRDIEEAKAVKKISDDPKFFFKYAKKFSSKSSKIGPLIDEEGSPVTDDKQVAEALSNQYNSVFSTPRMTMEEIEDIDTSEESQSEDLSNIVINRDNIKKAIAELSNSASPGPDGVPTRCYKHGGNTVLLALQDIFTESMETSVVVDEMKSAFISPIWKGDDRTLPSSYRPVALTTHLSKLMERVIRAPMVEFLEARGCMEDAQHGGRSGRSTLSQLLVQHDRVLKLLENGGNADIIYLDFSKAFDKVDQGLLLRKIRKMGISGKLWKWLLNFLTGRRQAVRTGSRISSWSPVLSGIPQGSVLGPLMFLIFISDLGVDLDTESLLLKYIDDSKVIRGSMTEDDIESLQAELEKLYKWQAANNMEWNGGKFCCLRLGSDQSLKENTILFTNEWKETITEVDQTKDLGVIIDNNCDFKAQRQTAIKKANRMAGWILRTFRSRDRILLRTLWRSLVEPHLDYSSQLWSPVGLVGEISAMEAPARNFTRRISGLKGMDYWTRLQSTNLRSTERRNERYKIIYSWKIIQGLVPNCGLSLSSTKSKRSGRLLDIPKLEGTRAHIQSLKDKSFQVEGPRLFNSLPEHLRAFNGPLPSFKGLLDRYLTGIPDQPYLPGYRPLAVDQNGRHSNSLKDWARISEHNSSAEVQCTMRYQEPRFNPPPSK